MVSVIIINHNYGRYLGEAIDSVLNQTYREFEIIIVDGASTDESREVIMSYVFRYPQIITAVLKPTSGQAAAFNVGVKLARGEIIALLDADDYYYPNKLKVIVRQHEEYDFVGHSRKEKSRTNDLTEVYAMEDDYEKRPYLLKQYGYIYTYNLITSCISMKKSLAEQIFPMPEKDYVTFADCYVKVLAQYYSNIKYIKNPLTYYRIHETQETMGFENYEEAVAFVNNLYKRVFRDINVRLAAENKPIIPELTDENFRKAFAIANGELKVEGKAYAIYGAGVRADHVINAVEKAGGKIVCAIDSNPAKWGIWWKGIMIYSPTEGIDKEKLGYEQIIIAAIYYEEIKNTLIDLGLEEGKDFIAIQSIPND